MVTPDEVKGECECDDCVGCAWTWFQGTFTQRARILASSSAQTSTPAHELGHVIGLGHIISATGVRPPFTMGVTTNGMFSPRGQVDELDPATVRMLETIYGAGPDRGLPAATVRGGGTRLLRNDDRVVRSTSSTRAGPPAIGSARTASRR